MLQSPCKTCELGYFEIHWCYHDNHSAPHCWSPTLQTNSRFNVPVSIFFSFSFLNMSSRLPVWRRWSRWNHQRLCQAHRDSHQHWTPETIMTFESFFPLFLCFSTDWDRFVCKSSAWIPSQTSVPQSLLFHGHFQASLRFAGGRNIPQFSPRCWIMLSDLHFLFIYKAANWLKRLLQGISILN